MSTTSFSRPALLGGPRAVTLHQADAHGGPRVTAEDEAAVLAVLRDGDPSRHPVARELEDDCRRRLGRRHALAHGDAAAALAAACFALDLAPGDEVLVPSAAPWTSVVPMLWAGLLPVFCDSEPERLGLDPDDAARRIGPRTRALVVVHLWGLPARMTELLDLARRRGLKVVEDASHALGAVWRGRPCGALGDVSIVSLPGGRPASAEGSMLLTDDDALYECAVCLGDVQRIPELPSLAVRFAATSFGLQTRLAPLAAALARSRLRRLDDDLDRRQDNLAYLSGRLQCLGFDTFRPPAHVRRTWFAFLVRPRPEEVGLSPALLAQALRAEGCDASLPRCPLLHQQPLFTEGRFARIARAARPVPVYDPHALPRTEAFHGQLLRLPTFATASRPLLDQYVTAAAKVVAAQDELARAALS